jgi:tetratricopeptide (TPR) repeat protein
MTQRARGDLDRRKLILLSYGPSGAVIEDVASIMAKPRRPQPRSLKSESTPAHPAAVAADARQKPQSSSSSMPPRRSTYFEAVAGYERGVDALQRHAYDEATALFQSVLKQFPEEKELLERVRLYLNICQRQSTPKQSAPETVDERLYAATLAINTGQYDEAIAHLRLVRDEDPDNDHALYMLAVAHAQRDEHAEAVAHLERAIALNGENRALARTDPDLEHLRDDDAFRAALESPPAVAPVRPPDRKRPPKTRSAR